MDERLPHGKLCMQVQKLQLLHWVNIYGSQEYTEVTPNKDQTNDNNKIISASGWFIALLLWKGTLRFSFI